MKIRQQKPKIDKVYIPYKTLKTESQTRIIDTLLESKSLEAAANKTIHDRTCLSKYLKNRRMSWADFQLIKLMGGATLDHAMSVLLSYQRANLRIETLKKSYCLTTGPNKETTLKSFYDQYAELYTRLSTPNNPYLLFFNQVCLLSAVYLCKTNKQSAKILAEILSVPLDKVTQFIQQKKVAQVSDARAIQPQSHIEPKSTRILTRSHARGAFGLFSDKNVCDVDSKRKMDDTGPQKNSAFSPNGLSFLNTEKPKTDDKTNTKENLDSWTFSFESLGKLC